jgi:hypothetical protein
MDMGAPINAQTGRRRDSRLRIRRGVPAQLLTLDGQATASLLDLSASGAHLRAHKPLRRGQDVMLWWLGFETFGKIVWVNGNEAGLEFYDPLHTSILLQTRQQVDAGLAPSTEQLAYAKAREWYLGHR